MINLLIWRYRRWRAAHYVWVADLDYRRHETPAASAAWGRAIHHLHEIETRRP